MSIGLARLLAVVGLVCGGVEAALAANATWSEEMTALPGSNWGAWDDFDGRMKGDIELVDANGNPGTGYWKRPLVAEAGTYGMVYVDGSSNPIDVLPSMAGPGPAQFTAEIRYKINGDVPDDVALETQNYDVMWWNVGGGNGSSNSGADIRMTEGVYKIPATLPGPGEPSNFAAWSGEGFQGSNPNIMYARRNDPQSPPNGTGTSPFPGPTTRGQWHTMRLIQDEIAQTQKVYIDTTLVANFSTASYNRGFGFTRGMAFGSYNVPTLVDLPEALYDYIRVANGIVPIGEAINAPVVACGGDVSGSTPGVPDGTTDGADLAYLYNHWGAVPTGTLGDISGTGGNPDGQVDGADVGKVYNCWAQADGAPASVPEPASIGVLGIGLIALLAASRKA